MSTGKVEVDAMEVGVWRMQGGGMVPRDEKL